MTLKELKRKFELTLKAKGERLAEIDQLKRDREKIDAEMLAAADCGDLDAYMNLDKKKRDIEAKIFVYSRSLPNPKNAVTRDEVVTAWDGFAKGYNKDTQAKYKAFLADCKELAKKYGELVRIQNAALIERNRAYEIMGEKPNSDILPMYMIPCTYSELSGRWAKSAPEIEFLACMGMITSEEADAYAGIIEGQRAEYTE